jgi:hypothetical protein
MPQMRSYWRRQERLSLPKMTIRPQWPWQVRLALGLVAVVACLVAVWWAYGLGRGGSGRQQAAQLEQQLLQLTQEREKLQTDANAAESKLNIEHAAQQQLMKQVKTLEAENNRLKEDLAFFESLMPADAGSHGGIAIRRMTLDSVAGNQVRYRLLVMQGGKRDVEFNGNLQLTLTGLQAGKSVTLQFPDAKAQNASVDQYKINFKHYQRLEGVLLLPDGMQVKSLQARVLERGQIRAQQSANL